MTGGEAGPLVYATARVIACVILVYALWHLRKQAHGCAGTSRQADEAHALFPDALHALDGYFHERDDALAQRFALETVIGLDAARRPFQDAVLVNARVPGHASPGEYFTSYSYLSPPTLRV